MFKRNKALDINIENYKVDTKDHAYVEKLSQIESTDARQLLDVGVDIDENARIGTYIQKDKSVIHCKTRQDGVEVMGISQAREKHAWLSDYMWKNISPDTDKFTLQAKENPHEGYFIHALAGVKTKHPVQSCLYIAKEGFSYFDNGRFNGIVLDEDIEYCYYVVTHGSYDNPLLPEPLLNKSQYLILT